MVDPRDRFAGHPCDTSDRWQTDSHDTWVNSRAVPRNAGRAYATPIHFDPPLEQPHNVVSPTLGDRNHSQPAWAHGFHLPFPPAAIPIQREKHSDLKIKDTY